MSRAGVWIIGFCVCAGLPTGAALAQAPTCESVEYSRAVLERMPDIAKHCQRVEQRTDGTLVAVVEAEVTRVYASSGVQVRVRNPDGTKSESRYFRTAPERRILVEGEPTRVRDLVVGQKLTVFIDVKRPVVAPEPVAVGESLEFVPLERVGPQKSE